MCAFLTKKRVAAQLLVCVLSTNGDHSNYYRHLCMFNNTCEEDI
jgi:hypothetical protein